MTLKSRVTLFLGLIATAALAALVVFTATGQPPTPESLEAPAPAADAVRTSFPGLIAANGEPDLPSLRTIQPAEGQVLQADGPFDDRFVLEDLAFNGSSVTGAVRITSDVSDVLDLQVLAGFHDAQGKLLGTARYVHHLGDEGHGHSGPPEEREEFTVPVPAELQQQAVSASLGIPVLVNE